jgi:hypothetical protein
MPDSEDVDPFLFEVVVPKTRLTGMARPADEPQCSIQCSTSCTVWGCACSSGGSCSWLCVPPICSVGPSCHA